MQSDKDIEGQILNVLLREAKDDYIVGEIVIDFLYCLQVF